MADTPPPATSSFFGDDLRKELVKEEAIANFGAMNKIREALLVGMSKAVDKGNDISKYALALETIHKQVLAAQEEMKNILQ